MKIALCPQLSLNTADENQFSQKSFEHKLSMNLQTLEKAVKEAKSKNAKLAVFGESFLHGFEALNFEYKRDIKIASGTNSPEIAKIKEIARKNKIAIAFGYFENASGAIFSSYMVIDSDGAELYNYRRVSKGWRISNACADYREGKNFSSFALDGKVFTTLLCGDFWEDELLPQIINFDQSTDAFLWPVHCDYTLDTWEHSEKDEYRRHSQILAKPVLFCNNYTETATTAKGGAYLWKQGNELYGKPAGKPSILICEI